MDRSITGNGSAEGRTALADRPKVVQITDTPLARRLQRIAAAVVAGQSERGIAAAESVSEELVRKVRVRVIRRESAARVVIKGVLMRAGAEIDEQLHELDRDAFDDLLDGRAA